MKLRRVEVYEVSYVYTDENGQIHQEFDGGISENQLEQVTINLLEWAKENNMSMEVENIVFTKEIYFEEVE